MPQPGERYSNQDLSPKDSHKVVAGLIWFGCLIFLFIGWGILIFTK